MAPTGGAQGGGDQGAGGVRAARRRRRSRERARRERLAGWRRQRKETKRRSLVGKGGELLIRPLVDGARLSSLGEKGKVRIVVAVIFSIVDQLLTRSLGLE